MKLLNKKIVKRVSLSNYDQDYKIRRSFNSESAIDNNTKLLIVGTLTPLDEKCNYFYSSNRNRIYGYIDDALGTRLEELKQKLRKAMTKKEINSIKKEIKSVLKEKNIALLDVIK